MSQDLKIIAVTFEINAHDSSGGRFSIPVDVQRILNIGDSDEFAITIEADAGTFAGMINMKSGPEIYGPDIRRIVREGDRIRVTAYSSSKRSE